MLWRGAAGSKFPTQGTDRALGSELESSEAQVADLTGVHRSGGLLSHLGMLPSHRVREQPRESRASVLVRAGTCVSHPVTCVSATLPRQPKRLIKDSNRTSSKCRQA